MISKKQNTVQTVLNNSLEGLLFISSLLLPVLSHAVIVSPDLEVITIDSVGNTPVTVSLQNTYDTAVPVCTYNIASTSPVPAVVRIDNIVDGNTQPADHSFDVYLQKASVSATAESANKVHCVISDVGEFTVGSLHWEARTHLSTVTSGRGNFSVNAADDVSSLVTGSFPSAVVLHQVITSNDASWSTTWAHSGNILNPVTNDTNIYIGKHVAADTDTTRANETVGFILFDQTSGTENGVAFDAALGADSIDGVDDNGNTYTAPTIDYRHGIASQHAMDGGDGGWAVLFGAAPLAGSAIDLAIDEDDIADAERSHTTEQVAYFLAEPVDVADLDVTVDDGTTVFTPGGSVVYTAVITNNGPNDATGVTVTNPAPSGLPTSTTISGWSCAPSGLATCTASGSGDINESGLSIPEGESLTYTITVAVPADFSGDINGYLSNTTTASNGNVDPISSNDSVTDINTNDADISVTIDDGSASYVPGTTDQYTVVMTNNGPRDAINANIMLNSPVDASIGNWSCVGSGAACPAGSGNGAIDETIALLSNTATLTYTVDVITPSDRTGDLDVTATVDAVNFDPVTADNSATDSNIQSSESDIGVTLSDGLTAYVPGTVIAYTAVVSNSGPSDASSVQLLSTAPAGTAISSWSCVASAGTACATVSGSGDINQTAASLPVGETLTFTIDLAVPSAFTGNLVFSATVSAAEADLNAANDSVSDIDVQNSQVDIAVGIDDSQTTYTPGTTVQYTAFLINNGPSDGTNAVFNLAAPASTSIASWFCTPAGGAVCPAASGAGDISQLAASLISGASLSYIVNLDVASSASGNLVTTVTASAAETDPVAANNTASDSDTQASIADISITNDDGNTSYTPGTTVAYTVTVNNAGPSDASAVNITSTAPVGATVSSWSCSGANCLNASGSGDIDETLTALPVGVPVTYTVNLDVSSGFTGNLDMVSSVLAAETDPVPLNNFATDSDVQSSSADIAVTNSDGTLIYEPGSTSVYTVTVSNIGPSDASNIVVNNAVPAGTTITSWSCVGSSCTSASGSGAISETIASLASGSLVTYTVNVDVPYTFTGTLVNSASASADEADPDSSNNSADDSNVTSPDSDGDGVPDLIEIANGTDPADPSDFLDTDGDGVPDFVELGQGTDPDDAASALDSDGDGLTDFSESGGDKEGDGVGDEFESAITDTDGDGVKDDLDFDADGDGLVDAAEGPGDSDGDGIPDFLDASTGTNAAGGDSDADGINDAIECPVYPNCADSDGDLQPNYADNNDDNDSLLTSFELGDQGGLAPADSDGDTLADYLEPNELDTDGNGSFNHLDADDDGDGVATIDELDANNDTIGDTLNPDDLDSDGIPDYLDIANGDGSGTDITGSGDGDGDGLSDAEECPAAPLCADSDGDGFPDYMVANIDTDGDGIPDVIEVGGDPAAPVDSDGDGIPDSVEDDSLDTDGDGIPNNLDADDDGDGIPTADELGSGGLANPADTDGDGVPDYLSPTKILTGLDGGAGAVNPLAFAIMLLITIIRNRQFRCLVKQQNSFQ